MKLYEKKTKKEADVLFPAGVVYLNSSAGVEVENWTSAGKHVDWFDPDRLFLSPCFYFLFLHFNKLK